MTADGALMITSLKVAGAIVVAGIGFFGVRQGRENARLRKRYRQALRDLLAFHSLEERYCESICQFPRPDIHACSIPAAKRSMRLLHRASGNKTPTDLATPQRIESELARL